MKIWMLEMYLEALNLREANEEDVVELETLLVKIKTKNGLVWRSKKV